MLKNTFIGCVLLTAIGGLTAWNFGWVSDKVDEVQTTFKRETAVARAEKMITDMETKASGLTEKARALRIDARTRELAAERDREKVEKTRAAMSALAKAAKDGGFPKPSEASPEDRAKTLSFAGRMLPGSEVYDTLDRWRKQAEREERQLKLAQIMITKLKTAADQFASKQQALQDHAAGVRGKLEELSMQRDLAKLDAELAELGANTSGVYAGDLGEALDTIQKEIDESMATIDVLKDETNEANGLTPDQVLSPATAAASESLDKLWD